LNYEWVCCLLVAHLGTLSASFGYTLGRDDRAAYLHKQQQIQQTRQEQKISLDVDAEMDLVE